MCRSRVKIIVELLAVLAMVSLVARNTKQAFLQDGILLIPEAEGEAETLVIVGDTRDTILTPSVRTRASVFVGKVAPRIAVTGVIFTHGGPLTL
jgi:hypothetical protein